VCSHLYFLFCFFLPFPFTAANAEKAAKKAAADEAKALKVSEGATTVCKSLK